MKAAFVQDGAVQVGELPDPVPGRGQALVRTHACGLCASDQHFLTAGQNIIDLSRRLGGGPTRRWSSPARSCRGTNSSAR